MNRHAHCVSLGILLALSAFISACASPQTAEIQSKSGQIRPWSYFGTSPKSFWWHDTVQVAALHDVAQKFGGKRTVAILDSGFLRGHEDVVPANVDLSGVELCSGSFGYPSDINGHGTALAGITLGKDKGLSTGGLAPMAKLLPVKIVCGVSTADTVFRGVEFAAIEAKKVDVILLALGPWPSDVKGGQNVHQLLADLVPKHPKILFVVASVWDGKTPYSFPDGKTYYFPPWTQLDNVLLVAGMTLDGSNEVEFSDKSGQIWAPARDIETASIEDATTPGIPGRHAPFMMQGTSAAAAIVAGCAAAVKLDSDTAAWMLKKRLMDKAVKTLPGGKPRLDCFGAVTP